MMATELRLKLKYKVGGKSRYHGSYGGNSRPAKLHRQLTDREKALHAAQPKKIMLLQANGKRKMVTVG
jgi:hypothetical protein